MQYEVTTMMSVSGWRIVSDRGYSAVRILFLFLLLLVVQVTPGSGQECPFGAFPCLGRHGTGCYDPTYAVCHDGLICTNTMSACFGRHGTGCYNPAYRDAST